MPGEVREETPTELISATVLQRFKDLLCLVL